MYQALASLFVIAVGSGWENFMFLAAQTTSIDQIPLKWASPYWMIFFIGFMIIGNFFFLNLIVSVIISSFN